jgi:hypothetical protein
MKKIKRKCVSCGKEYEFTPTKSDYHTNICMECVEKVAANIWPGDEDV